MNSSLTDWQKVFQPNGSCTIASNLSQRLQTGSKSNNTDEFQLQKCQKFIFDNSISDSTIQSEWSVVCDNATLLHVIEMCFLAGAAIGSLFSGTLSDEYGRRHTLMIVVALQAIIGKNVISKMPKKVLKSHKHVIASHLFNIDSTLKIKPVFFCTLAAIFHFLHMRTKLYVTLIWRKNSQTV